MIDLLLKKWWEVVSYKNIKTSIRGKRARELLRRLVVQYKRNPQDILKIFKTLQENTTFELYWLVSDETFEKYLKEAELLIKQDAYSGYKGLLPGITGFFEVYISPKLYDIKSGDLTYVDLLLSLPRGIRETIWWFAIDPVLYYAVKHKVISLDMETNKEIRNTRKRKAFMKKIAKEYRNILDANHLFKEILYEAFDVLQNFINPEQYVNLEDILHEW